MFGFLKLSLKVVESHHFLGLLLVEVEDDEVVELCLLIVVDIELSLFKAN